MLFTGMSLVLEVIGSDGRAISLYKRTAKLRRHDTLLSIILGLDQHTSVVSVLTASSHKVNEESIGAADNPTCPTSSPVIFFKKRLALRTV